MSDTLAEILYHFDEVNKDITLDCSRRVRNCDMKPFINIDYKISPLSLRVIQNKQARLLGILKILLDNNHIPYSTISIYQPLYMNALGNSMNRHNLLSFHYPAPETKREKISDIGYEVEKSSYVFQIQKQFYKELQKLLIAGLDYGIKFESRYSLKTVRDICHKVLMDITEDCDRNNVEIMLQSLIEIKNDTSIEKGTFLVLGISNSAFQTIRKNKIRLKFTEQTAITALCTLEKTAILEPAQGYKTIFIKDFFLYRDESSNTHIKCSNNVSEYRKRGLERCEELIYKWGLDKMEKEYL